MSFWDNTNKKERNDLFIALFVLLFFAWILWFMVFRGKNDSHLEKESSVSFPAYKYVGNKDKDHDGVVDSLDLCPNEYGLSSNNGCPVEEKTPLVPILAGKKKDSDGDGISDDRDSCAYLAGPAPSGCPDSDGDGIYDIDDVCPDEVGLKENHGCPDADGDGVVDQDDHCPTESGLSETQGCPDADGDGVADKDDKCPEEAGSAENEGCPQVAKLSEEDQTKLDLAVQNVQFEYNSDQLKSSSYENLEGVAEILNENKNFRLKLDGHTDSHGKDEFNLELSQKRADACKNYLVSLGIDPDRITATGHGESQPIASNDTDEGRRQNRRVEFTIVQ